MLNILEEFQSYSYNQRNQIFKQYFHQHFNYLISSIQFDSNLRSKTLAHRYFNQECNCQVLQASLITLTNLDIFICFKHTLTHQPPIFILAPLYLLITFKKLLVYSIQLSIFYLIATVLFSTLKFSEITIQLFNSELPSTLNIGE